MQPKTKPTIKQYPRPLRCFHWLMAVIVIGMIILGFTMANVLTDEPYTRSLYNLHKSFGFLVLILVVLWIATRLKLKHEVPPLSATLPKYERIGAKIGHISLFAFVFIAASSGYLMSSLSPKSSGVALFGLPVSKFMPKNGDLASIFAGIHEISVYCLAALIAVHIAAVIKHLYFDKLEKDVMKRMW